MKNVLVLCFLIALLVFTHSSRIVAEEVDNLDNLNRCYETYLSSITQLAERGKAESEACIRHADAQRDAERQKAEKDRSVLAIEVEAVQHSLIACTAEEDISRYFSCMRNEAPGNKKTLTAIKDTSSDFSKQLDQALEAVQPNERSCVASVNAKVKQETDSAFNALQNCQKNKN